ncbi:PucR family transcriptional regulator [Streptomyces sp. NWU339]|uniref:PucR family transcriptional regulator n=1 Tax=Streptomyces sp. NWU339 TaxID=2185284 RepID=UPI000D676DB3|nr:helix-turn-helix domain-containing protein [Streptomyces sp. NWU339]PWI07527.1 PucR family transcriptional regulator [Streptomyces sp. NWU339]
MTITVTDLVDSLGAGFLRTVVAARDAEVHDVALAEPGDAVGQPGELVLGVGVADRDGAVALLERAARAAAGGVVLKGPFAGDPQVARAARELAGPALVELQPHTSWAHVVWLLRGVIDRASAPDTSRLGSPGPHADLFALADAAAEIIDAPVTVEDAQSRVLAYSARQDTTDPARVSTIVGRRVPPETLTHFRAGGVFRRLARSSDPIWTPAGPDGTLPRLIIPVRAGGEWLGSIWAVVRSQVPPERIRELSDVASVLALHLLRLRAEAGIARRVSTGQLRVALREGAASGSGPGAAPGPVVPGPGAAPALPAGPWRVVAFGSPDGTDIRRQLDLWESVALRFGWHQPLLTDLDGLLFGLVAERPRGRRPVTAGGMADAGAGTLDWLRHVLREVHAHDPGLYAAAGCPADSPDQLPRATAEAGELHRLIGTGRLPLPDRTGIVLMEDAWDAVVVERATAAVGIDTGLLGGPLAALRAHDEEHGTPYRTTLAAWLDHFGDPQSAARLLRIHPNTLRYRLRKLDEVAPVDLSSPRVRLALRLQLTAMGEGPRPAGR